MFKQIKKLRLLRKPKLSLEKTEHEKQIEKSKINETNLSLNKPVNIDLNVVLKEATLRIVELKQTLNPTSQNSKKKYH